MVGVSPFPSTVGLVVECDMDAFSLQGGLGLPLKPLIHRNLPRPPAWTPALTESASSGLAGCSWPCRLGAVVLSFQGTPQGSVFCPFVIPPR